MEKAAPIELGISTADAEYPSFSVSNGTVVVSYVDWKENPVTLRFHEVAAVSWQEAEQLLENEPYDGVAEISDSNWVKLHQAQELLPADSSPRHVNLNFNECGKLSVLFVGEVQVSATDA